MQEDTKVGGFQVGARRRKVAFQHTTMAGDMDNVNRRRPCVMNYAVSRVIEATVFLQRLGLDVKRVLRSRLLGWWCGGSGGGGGSGAGW